MKTTNLIRIGILPILALLVFACKKEMKTDSTSTVMTNQTATQRVSQQGPAVDWSVDIQVTKNECNEQVFTLKGLNKNGIAIAPGDGEIELTITDANGIVVGSPYTGASPLVVTTQLAPGSYTLSAKVSTGINLRGLSAPTVVTVEACACPFKGLDELTCADLPDEMLIGTVTYDHDKLCQLLAYNRGNQGYGALVRLVQAVLVAKVNDFTSANQAVAAAEALIGNLNALDYDDQASVVDQYGAPEKGHVQDLVKCSE